MSLRFIYGRAGSGKSYFCMETIKKALEKENNLILLIPEQFSFGAEKGLLKVAGERSVTKARVLSFKRLSYRVFNEVGGAALVHMNEAGKSMLIYNIMNKYKNELDFFGDSIKKQGFVQIVSQLITEFKRYNITPEDINITTEGEENPTLKNKLKDIQVIYENFESNLKDRYLDAEDDLTIIYDKLDKSDLFKKAEVWIDEFSSFTPQQYLIIEKILKQAKRVNITLCTGDDELFKVTQSTEEKITNIARENNIAIDKPISLKCSPCYRFRESLELQHLEKNIFSYPYKAYEGKTKDVSLFRALNRYSEIEAVARNIIALCRDKNVRFKDIAVVAGDIRTYEKLIKSIFTEYDIPHFIDKKREVINNPVVILILSAVEVISRNWSYESVFRYLKTGLLDISNEEIDLIENYVLANGIKGKKKWLDEGKWEYRYSYEFEDDEKSSYEEQILEKVNEVRNKITNNIVSLQQKLKKKDKCRSFCEYLYEFLTELKVPEKLQSFIEKFEKEKRIDMANEYRGVWEVLVDILDQIVEVMGEEEVSVDEFSKLLKAGFEEYEIGVIPATLDEVLISSAERVKSHKIKHLFVIGANDGVFPSPIKEEGILTDMDRQMLLEKGMELAKDSKSRAFEEQFLIYSTITNVSNTLMITYAVSDTEGKALRPSIIISRLKKIFPKITEMSNVIENKEEDIYKISSPIPTFNELIANIKYENEELNISDLWLQVYDWYSKNEDFKSNLQRVLSGFNYTNQEEIFNTKKLRMLYGKPLTLSVSRLERFSACPFAYFVKYGLRAKERKLYGFTTPDMGTFMHGVIDVFSKSISKEKKSWRDIDKDWSYNLISQIVDDRIREKANSILNSSERYKYMTEKFKNILLRAIMLISEHMKKGGFNPKGYEISFGKSGEFPEIVVELHSGETVNLIGRVDRIDALEEEDCTYIRIIDYKSGKKEFKLSDAYYGLQMQLIIYLDSIICELLNEKNNEIKPAGILYFKIDDPIIKAKGDMSEEEIEKTIMKNLKMDGLLLDDTHIIKAMDNEAEGGSLIIPASINKSDGNVSKSSSVATETQFKILRDYTRKMIGDLCEHMLEGDIGIKPYKCKDNTPCSYCDYGALCLFDTALKDNRYKVILDKKDQEIWELMRKEVEEHE